jgi:uncharacterized protein
MIGDAQREVTVAWNGIRLAGTLHLPDSRPPHPLVLMLQGSGPSDRDSNGYFPPIRDLFLSRGIAVYSFDKPGIGGSSGDWRHYALNGRAEQATAALMTLREHPAIDRRRMGIWGQSQGGWLVQILAARLPGLAFAIANSGAAIGVEAQDRYGCEHTMRGEGKDEETIARALSFLGDLHQAARRGEPFASVERSLLGPARGAPWSGYLALASREDWEMICRFIGEGYDPAATLAQVRCPILAIFGARDDLVPAWESAAIYGESLQRAGNPDATIAVFPQGNHRILVPDTGAFAAGYLDLLGDWAARRARREANQ